MKIEKRLLEPFDVTYTNPVLPAMPDNRFMVGAQTQFPEVNLYKQRVSAVTAKGLVFSSSKKLFRFTSRTLTGRPIKRRVFFFWLKKKRFSKFSFLKKAILVFDDWSGNYFHFWNDLMPRLYLCKETVRQEKLTILTDVHTARLANQLFPYFGFEDVKCITSNEACFVAELYYPEFVRINVGLFHEATLKGMKRYIFEKLGLTHSSKKQRIYISRSKAKCRKISNEDELHTVLIQFGFRIVYTEDLSVLEQINLFKDTEAIIGLHGAGLGNMLFCEGGTKIIELRQAGGVQNNLFYQLASTLGHPYYCFFSDNADSDDFQQADFSIDTNLFIEFMKNIYSTCY